MFLAITVNANTVASPVVEVKTIDQLIDEKSAEYNVSASLMRKIIHCESSGNPNAVGDGGYSFGLVQIHSPSWPDITQEQAVDPEFAINFLAKKLSEDKGHLWTCYRMITQ